MLKNTYTGTSTSKIKNIYVKNIMDLLYSYYSIQIIYGYSYYYLNHLIKKKISKINFSHSDVQKLTDILLETESFFIVEFLNWIIFNFSYKENKNNIFIPRKVHNIEELYEIVDIIISSYNNILNLSFSQIKNIFFKKMNYTKILPFLEKHHLPPLASDTVFNSYFIKDSKDTSGNTYMLYRKNDIISKLPLEYIISGVLFNNQDLNFINVKLQHFIKTKYISCLKKRYIGNSEYFNNSVFYLFTCYTANGLINNKNNIIFEIPKIKDTKINNLYKQSIELLGSPLSVDSDKKYFGLFPDVEKLFGSLGSFYDFKPTSGVYSIQFQLSYFFIKKTVDKVFKWLDTAFKNNEKLTFMLWMFNISNIKDIYYDILQSLINNIVKSKYFKDKYEYGAESSFRIIYILSTF